MKAGKLNIQGGKNINVAKRKVANARSAIFNQHNVNVVRSGIRELQQRVAITELSASVSGTVTSLSINVTSFDIIKANDKLILVHPVTGVASDIQATEDVKATDTSISIASVTLYSPSGSFIMFQEEFLNYFVRGGTITYKTTIANADYKTLNTSPVTLVAGQTGLVMIPVNLLIITSGYSSDEENNDRYLYCGHSTSTLGGRYWDSIRSFNYRVRSNSTWNMTGDTGVIHQDSIKGEGINLYAGGSFESDDFSLLVYLTYRIDSD